MMDTLSYFIHNLPEIYNSQIAISYHHRFRSTRYTYKELYTLAQKCATFFLSKGVQKGDRVLIYGENCPEWVVTLLSCGLTGIVLVPIDHKSPIAFAKKICKETEVKYIVSDNVIPDTNTPTIKLCDLCKQIDSHALFSSQNLDLTGDDPLEIVYTSGTTSAPKGAIITHRNFVASIRGIRKQHLVCDNHCHFLSMLPLSHVLEQNAGCLSILRFGGQIVYTKEIGFTRTLEILKEEKISHIIAVPAILEQFAKKIRSEVAAKKQTPVFNLLLLSIKYLPLFMRRALTFLIRRKISLHLKAFICGGAHLSASTEAFWENLGVMVVQGYGLTESCAMCCANTFGNRKKGSVGSPLPTTSLQLAESGEILLKGETIVTKYYKAPALNKAFFKNGWYHTGDIGRLDKEGNVYIVGRLKEMILTANGMNVFPVDIEWVLAKTPGIKEGAVFEDPQARGKLLAAVITDINFDESRAIQSINAQLAPHQRLAKLIKWSQLSLPKTPSLKIKRNELAKIYLQQLLDVAHQKSPPACDPLLEILVQISKSRLESLKPKTLLTKDLGMDSLDLAHLVIRIESQFRVRVDEAQFSEECTIEQLRSSISNSQKAQSPPPIPHYLLSHPIRAIGKVTRFIGQKVFYKWVQVRVLGELPIISPNRPTIFIANHTSHLDGYAIASTLPEHFKHRVAAAAAYDYFFGKQKLRGFVMSLLILPLLPFHRNRYFSENLKNIGKLFGKGDHLLIFPEGTRSRDGQMAAFKPGIGMIVKEMNAQVVPLFIQGAHKLWPPQRFYPKRGKVEVRYGEPLSFDSNKSAKEITSILEAVVRDSS